MSHSFARGSIAALLLLAACSVPPPSARTAEAPPVPVAEPKVAQAPRAEPPAPPVDARPAPAVPAAPAAPSPPPAAPPPAKSPAKPAPAAPKASSPPSPAAPPAQAAVRAPAATLDLRTLEQRLKETNAIGLLTKLSLKNQVDDLVTRFRTFHEGRRPPTLSELRPAFELLLMKVLSLLQDKDTALAKDIDVSREAIWGVLTDREKLSTSL